VKIEYEKDGDILKALGHPVRLKIVHGLLRHECNVSEIVKELGLPQSTVSQHLGILRNRGIIAPTKKGVISCYHVIDKRVEKVVKVLEK